LTKKKLSKAEKKSQKSSWIADGIGKRVSASLQRFGGMDGTDAPFIIDLEETMKMTIDSAMGIPRPVELIDADLERLAAELIVSKEYYTKEEAAAEKVEGVTKQEDEAKTNGGKEETAANVSSGERGLPTMTVDNAQVGSSGGFDACCGTGF
jgi:hypothetical protein